jgi:hypothetical protein
LLGNLALFFLLINTALRSKELKKCPVDFQKERAEVAPGSSFSAQN